VWDPVPGRVGSRDESDAKAPPKSRKWLLSGAGNAFSMPSRGGIGNPLPRLNSRKKVKPRAKNPGELLVQAELNGSRVVSSVGLEQSCHTFKQGSQRRCGLRWRFDHDVTTRGAADLEQVEAFAHFRSRR
jgi:hypothetical protein